MLWAAAMGIKVGGLSRTVAQPRPHADRLPNEDSSCDSRHECVQRATTRPPLACTVCSTRVRAGIRAKFCTIMLGISSTDSAWSWFSANRDRILFYRSSKPSKSFERKVKNFYMILRYFHYNTLMQMYNICVLKVFQFKIYIPFNWIGRTKFKIIKMHVGGEYS